MFYEESFGSIPLKIKNKNWYTFLVKNKSGNHWGFPKGHANLSESEKQTALRELQEETNLKVVKFLVEKPIVEQYIFFRNSEKTAKKVYYFLVEVEGDAKITSDEILEGKWIELTKAKDLITYDASKELVNQVEIILQRL